MSRPKQPVPVSLHVAASYGLEGPAAEAKRGRRGSTAGTLSQARPPQSRRSPRYSPPAILWQRCHNCMLRCRIFRNASFDPKAARFGAHSSPHCSLQGYRGSGRDRARMSELAVARSRALVLGDDLWPISSEAVIVTYISAY